MKSVDDLYCLPKRSEAYTNLQNEIDRVMSGLEYSAPISGEHQQTVQMADLDGDGQIENISGLAGPTSGLFSFRLTVQDAITGQQEYAGVFYSAAMELSLEQQDGKLYLCGAELNRGEEHRYDVTMKGGAVFITENGVPIGGTMGE